MKHTTHKTTAILAAMIALTLLLTACTGNNDGNGGGDTAGISASPANGATENETQPPPQGNGNEDAGTPDHPSSDPIAPSGNQSDSGTPNAVENKAAEHLGAMGNTNGNYRVGARLATDGQYIYSGLDYSLFRINTEPSSSSGDDNNTPLYYSYVSYINVMDGWVYFIEEESNTIVRIRPDGSEETVYPETAYKLFVSENWVYFMSAETPWSTQYALYRMAHDGQGKTAVFHGDTVGGSFDDELFSFSDEWIYMSLASNPENGESWNNYMWRMRPDGSDLTEFELMEKKTVVNGNFIYSFSGDSFHNAGSLFYRTDLDGNNKQQIGVDMQYSYNVGCFSAHGEYLYFTDSYYDIYQYGWVYGNIYMINIATDEITRISDYVSGDFYIAVFDESRIFYMTEPDQYGTAQWRSMRTDGTDEWGLYEWMYVWTR